MVQLNIESSGRVMSENYRPVKAYGEANYEIA